MPRVDAVVSGGDGPLPAAADATHHIAVGRARTGTHCAEARRHPGRASIAVVDRRPLDRSAARTHATITRRPIGHGPWCVSSAVGVPCRLSREGGGDARSGWRGFALALDASSSWGERASLSFVVTPRFMLE